MATIEQQTTPPLAPMEITSIQPGGGSCMSRELAWGKFRRAWLRRFRPGYVRRMAELRMGQCPDCPHDVIDSRDLKLYRNVCGYRFPNQPDPCRRIPGLPLARAGLAEVVIFSLAFLTAGLLLAFLAISVHDLFWIPVGIVMVLWIFVFSFFRDPERVLPTDRQALVSPADGTVTHIDEVEDSDFPGGRVFRISIFLSVFNVHVNRMPRDATVVAVRYFPGCFLDARDPECTVRNEQLWLDLKEAGTERLLRVKQISGAIARRIVCWVRPGEKVQAGDRYGMIKFGSRTEVLLAADAPFEVKVKVGQKVRGGSTVLLSFAYSSSE